MGDSCKKEDSNKSKKQFGTPKFERFASGKRSRSSPEQLGGVQKRSVGNTSVEGQYKMDEAILIKLGEMLDAKLDAKLSLVATKNDINSLEGKLENILEENRNLKKEIIHLKQENKSIKENTEFLMKKLKAKNIVINGLQGLKEDEDNINIVKELCVKSLGINEPMIDRAFTIGHGQALIVEFVKQYDVQSVLRNARKLKGTGIWINRDLTHHARQKKKKLLEIRKRVMEVEKGERVLVRDDYLLFKNKKFSWDEEKGITAANEEDLLMLLDILKKKIEGSVTASKNGI